MKKFVFVFAGILLSGCALNSPKMDTTGTYEAVLPCADCAGIKSTLSLKENNEFCLNSEYLGTKTNEQECGKYSVEKGLITAETGTRTLYFCTKGDKMRLLDAEKKPVTGETAKFYIFNKVK